MESIKQEKQSNLDHNKANTKIMCTIGPSSSDLKTLKNMYDHGMTAVRINTAHGDFKAYKSIIVNVRKVAQIPVVIDIKGPELRIRCEKKYEFKKKTPITIGRSNGSLHFNYDIISKLRKGDKILIEDGKYILMVSEVSKKSVIAYSDEDCVIEPNKNVHIPGKSLKLPSLTQKDLESIKFAIKNNADFIALSFCRSKIDVINLRRKLGNSEIKIIAKIENNEGVNNINEIINEADGIMVARGDLGVVLSPEKVPLAQKKIIKSCNEQGKLVIVATQMLESMIDHPVPTRAEISDIANAVLDGADCLMLSAETAVGKFPVEAVTYMHKAAKTIEHAVMPVNSLNETKARMSLSESISHCVHELSTKIHFTKIVCLTYGGNTARRISRFRINKPIIAVTSSPKSERQLMLYYGILPIVSKTDFWDPSVLDIFKELYERKKINANDTIIFTAGIYTTKIKKTNTNTVQIHNVGDIMEYISKKRKS